MGENARGRRSRSRLLDAGIEVAATLSARELLAGVRAPEVAARAGLTTGAFYHAFRDHDGFVDALVEYALLADGAADDEMVERTLEALLAYAEAPDVRLVADLQALADLNMTLSVKAASIHGLEYALWACRDDPMVGPRLRSLYRSFTDDFSAGYDLIFRRWARVPRPPFTTERIAVVLTALVDGLVLRHGIEPESAPIETFGQAVLALLPAITRPLDDKRNLCEFLEDYRVPDWRTRVGRTRRRRSQRDVIDAALDLLEDSPFDDLTVERIAEEAGVHPSTVYDNFGSKVGLAGAAFARLIAPLIEVAEHDLAAGVAPLDVIRSQMRRLAEIAIANTELLPGLFRWLEQTYLSTQPDEPDQADRRDNPDRQGRSDADNVLPRLILPAVVAAQRDGSLRADLDPLGVAAILTGLVVRTVALQAQAGAELIVDYLYIVCFEGLYPRPAAVTG